MKANSETKLQCVICGEPAEYACVYCNSNVFCEKHFCKHVQQGIEAKTPKTEDTSGTAAKIVLGLIIVVVIMALLSVIAGSGDGSYHCCPV
jgi:hypothetical protein